jgi:isoleucyl-tRNA synthetase
MNREFWRQIMDVRTVVSKELEKTRTKGDIGSGLNAEVELYCNDKYFNQLNFLENELHFIFITSNASIYTEQFTPADAVPTELDGLKLKIVVSPQPKCVRCWHQRYDVGEHKEHPELCGRCVVNVAGEGEIRRYA